MKDTAVFQLDHNLILNPHDLRRVYGVTIVFDQDGKEQQHIRFEIEVLVKKDNATKNWLFQFDRRNVFINRKKPSGVAEKLAYECGQVLYPLQIEVSGNEAEKIIKSRHFAIKQLKMLRKKTSMTQKSVVVDNYFAKAWDTLKEPSSYVKAIEQNIFLSFFFAPIYGRYNVLSNSKNSTMNIPMIPFCKGVAYSVQQKVNPQYSSFNTITVLQEGELTDQRTQKDFIHRLDEPIFIGKEQSKKTEGQMTAKYELDTDTRVIRSIHAKSSIVLPNNQGRSFEFQAYYLPERNKLIKNSLIQAHKPLKDNPHEQ
ncbi:hypothetical protein [Spongiimicrobium salis]|uniref:hypothetical protein n=1 Tax=Spongiimicrobium salis TaxID=1667022 RepID=UPI00374D0895